MEQNSWHSSSIPKHARTQQQSGTAEVQVRHHTSCCKPPFLQSYSV